MDMLTTFQKLCIRPEPGFAYDKASMVDLPDGGSFTELLCKVTSKCDTSILLLSSHKGKIRDFTVKLIGIHLPQSQSMSVTSTVLSGFKKSLSFFNGNTSSSVEDSQLTDVDQISQAWQEGVAARYHGMQVLTMLELEVMPDNECRKLYNLHQFATVTLQSINAYYMFQKPEVAFVYDADFTTQQLKDAYPNADAFAVAVMWRFAEDPTCGVGRIRPTPIVRTSIRSEPVLSVTPRPSRLSKFSDSPLRQDRPGTTTSITTTTTKRKVTEVHDILHGISSSRAALLRSPSGLKSARGGVLAEEVSDEESSSPDTSIAPQVPGKARVLTVFRTTTTATPKISSPVSQNTSSEYQTSDSEQEITVAPQPAAAAKKNAKSTVVPAVPKRSTRQEVVSSPEKEIELPAVKATRRMANRQNVSGRRLTKRQQQQQEEEQTVTGTAQVEQLHEEMQQEACEQMDVDDALAAESTIDPNSIVLPFDEASSGAKPRVGRKSMVASARKSLASEWPQADQDHMLHFFDNLNPSQSETSRVALTCKYALIQYDRDLSSKLLFQWVENKGRTVQREVIDFTLPEDEQKKTVLDLYRTLNDVQNEATRVSFTLKFIHAQYGVNITSKQLFGWLKEKPKKGKK